ncbi:MAG TPA: hypothetical protein VH413_01355 [Verrucomicrobiae bacterium]|jgi:hypothetical protein|nr:hypothetical protein [Verrucomicrobiae bacterium]
MKRYRLVYRGSRNMFYYFDTHVNKRESLGTSDKAEAQRLIAAKNEAVLHVGMNLQIAQVYLQHSDPAMATRTWQHVFETIIAKKHGTTQARWACASRDKAFDLIRNRTLVETTSQFLSFVCSINSAVAKNFVPFCGGLPSGLSNLAATRTGTS